MSAGNPPPNPKPDPNKSRVVIRPDPEPEEEMKLVEEENPPMMMGLDLPMVGDNDKASAKPAPKPPSSKKTDAAEKAPTSSLDLPLVGDAEAEEESELEEDSGEIEAHEIEAPKPAPRAVMHFNDVLKAVQSRNQGAGAEPFSISQSAVLILILNAVITIGGIVYIYGYHNYPLPPNTTHTAAVAIFVLMLIFVPLIQSGIFFSIGWGVHRILGRSSSAGNIAICVVSILIILRNVIFLTTTDIDASFAKMREQYAQAEQRNPGSNNPSQTTPPASGMAAPPSNITPQPEPSQSEPQQPVSPSVALTPQQARYANQRLHHFESGPLPDPQLVPPPPEAYIPPVATSLAMALPKPPSNELPRATEPPATPEPAPQLPSGSSSNLKVPVTPEPAPASGVATATPGTPVAGAPDPDDFPELAIADAETTSSAEEAEIIRVKKLYFSDLKPLLKEYRVKTEAFRDAGGMDLTTLTPDAIDERTRLVSDMKTAYEPYYRFITLTPNYIRLQLQKSNLNEGKTIKVIDDIMKLLDAGKYEPSKSLDLATITRINTVFTQVKKLPIGWRASSDGQSLLDKSGRPLDQLNEYIANTHKKASKSGILKILG